MLEAADETDRREDRGASLSPLLAELRHKPRARMRTAYVSGLIGPRDRNRKSIQPMAARDGDTGYDRLHHFIASGTWHAAPQYASMLVKNAGCQTLVSLTLASREVLVMIGLRLFLPESWTSDADRLAHVGVSEERRAYRTKPEIARVSPRSGCALPTAQPSISMARARSIGRARRPGWSPKSDRRESANIISPTDPTGHPHRHP